MASTSEYDILATPPKALTFDVFGTTVNWRETVTSTLIARAAAKLSSGPDLSPELRSRLASLTDEDWARFAQEWRNTYKKFTHGFVPGETPWRDIDTHHHLSLVELLAAWELAGAYTDDEVRELSLVWHWLAPWADSSEGMRLLNRRFTTSTLSNGNPALLRDLQAHGDLGFAMLQSSADFAAYKPHPRVYRGVVERLGLPAGEVAMVAAHLNDLAAARACGYRTIYVEREREEDWSPEQEEYREARSWVDMWIGKDERGFVEMAARFGLE